MKWTEWLGVAANIAQIISVGPLLYLAYTALKLRWDRHNSRGPSIWFLD